MRRLAVGSTSERRFEAGDTTDARLDDLIADARMLCPVLGEMVVAERWAGLRPRAVGRDPMVGPMPDLDNVIALTGGFKISFGIAHRMAEAALSLVPGKRDQPFPKASSRPFLLRAPARRQTGWRKAVPVMSPVT